MTNKNEAETGVGSVEISEEVVEIVAAVLSGEVEEAAKAYPDTIGSPRWWNAYCCGRIDKRSMVEVAEWFRVTGGSYPVNVFINPVVIVELHRRLCRRHRRRHRPRGGKVR